MPALQPESLGRGPASQPIGTRPRTTYRLQLHRGFDFDAATAIVPYLSVLGVTDCYVSPIFTAVPGSTHGYDVCRHTEINPELGGEPGFSRFADTLRSHGMGLILDFVPNHMSNDPHTNEWWRDVLENGPSSTFARFFDIDWDPTKSELKDRLLLPILGEPYGEALERGALVLRFDAGGLLLEYGDFRLPINPRRTPLVFEHDLERLEDTLGTDHSDLHEFLSILTALRNLPPYTERSPRRIAERHREKEVARNRLAKLVDASPPVREHITRAIAVFNGVAGHPRSFDRLHDLLERQAYRLASWRTAADEINYRRFFDINALAGLRVEDTKVFDTIHSLLLRLVQTGQATGIRLDHIDGLFDPQGYLVRLNEVTGLAVSGEHGEASALPASNPQPVHRGPYVVVEKILSGSELLRGSWPVAGTTGYTFLNDVNGVFIDTRRAKRLQRIYARISGRREPFAEVAYESKRLIVSTALSSEFQVLAQAVNRISEADRRFRDFTLGSIRRALREVVACFPVYRTYVGPAGMTAADDAAFETAVAEARRRNPAMESSIFDFLRFVLLPRLATESEQRPRGRTWRSRVHVAMRFQQYTAPVQAKGIEDTAFYRYHVLASLNEVGGDPARIGRTVAEFHKVNEERRLRWPGEMLATTTHDTKRSEDARARINVLSEIPDQWQVALSQWRRINAANRTRVGGAQAPDANDEYLFYQTLLGAWPADSLAVRRADQLPADLVARLKGYMEKAIKEAKLHTSWITPNVPYENATAKFVERTLTGRSAPGFLTAFLPFVQRIAAAGACNSLAQLVLKLASPGVPDFYQGTELWDLSLVDPDNRRPIDWESRARILDGLAPHLSQLESLMQSDVDGASCAADVNRLLLEWADGRIKALVTALGMRARRAVPGLFLDGEYVALEAAGERAGHLIAFARTTDRHALVAAVPRLTLQLTSGGRPFPLSTDAWKDTVLCLPPSLSGLRFRNLLTGERLDSSPATSSDTPLRAAQVLASFPVALLWARRADGPP